MRLKYASFQVEKYCTSLKEAKRLFGGSDSMAVKLMARIQQLEAAKIIKDLACMRTLRLHPLKNIGKSNYAGKYAIDIKNSHEPWRLIIEFLDDEEHPYKPSHLDSIIMKSGVIYIIEVSKHYD